MREYIVALKSTDTGKWVAYGYQGAQPFRTEEEAERVIGIVRGNDQRNAVYYKRPLTWADYMVVMVK